MPSERRPLTAGTLPGARRRGRGRVRRHRRSTRHRAALGLVRRRRAPGAAGSARGRPTGRAQRVVERSRRVRLVVELGVVGRAGPGAGRCGRAFTSTAQRPPGRPSMRRSAPPGYRAGSWTSSPRPRRGGSCTGHRLSPPPRRTDRPARRARRARRALRPSEDARGHRLRRATRGPRTRPRLPSGSLRSVTPRSRRSATTRARHVVTENARVVDFARALRRGDPRRSAA